LKLAIVLSVLAIALACARAEGPPGDERRARAQFDIGRAHFRLGEYDQAIAAFERGYGLAPLPLFLYNIAQAQRLSGRFEAAVENYRKYRDAAPDGPERANADRYIFELTEQLKGLTQSRPPAAAPVANPAVVAAPPPAPPPHRSRRRLWIGLGVTAAVLVAAGAATGLAIGLTRASAPSTALGNYCPFCR
jgi:tetratricopeptide (TPR) repeat protein